MELPPLINASIDNLLVTSYRFIIIPQHPESPLSSNRWHFHHRTSAPFLVQNQTLRDATPQHIIAEFATGISQNLDMQESERT